MRTTRELGSADAWIAAHVSSRPRAVNATPRAVVPSATSGNCSAISRRVLSSRAPALFARRPLRRTLLRCRVVFAIDALGCVLLDVGRIAELAVQADRGFRQVLRRCGA